MLGMFTSRYVPCCLSDHIPDVSTCLSYLKQAFSKIHQSRTFTTTPFSQSQDKKQQNRIIRNIQEYGSKLKIQKQTDGKECCRKGENRVNNIKEYPRGGSTRFRMAVKYHRTQALLRNKVDVEMDRREGSKKGKGKKKVSGPD